MIELDHRNSHIGTIKFVDNSCIQFTGVANFENIANDAAFQGYKVKDGGGSAQRAWSNYSEKAYEYEGRARWRR